MQQILDYITLPRSTRELARLNEIHGAFNDKKLTPEQTRKAVYMHKWKYHHDKVDMLIGFTFLFENHPITNNYE